jgi:hypothetical protein
MPRMIEILKSLCHYIANKIETNYKHNFKQPYNNNSISFLVAVVSSSRPKKVEISIYRMQIDL